MHGATDLNNLFLISTYASNDFSNNIARQSKAPQKASFFGDPAFPAALKDSHVSVNKYINPLKKLQTVFSHLQGGNEVVTGW